MSLEQLASVTTILAFVVYVFIEWPRIFERFQTAQPVSGIILTIIGVLSAIIGVILLSIDILITSGIWKITPNPMVPALGLTGAGLGLFAISVTNNDRRLLIFKIDGLLFFLFGLAMLFIFK